VLPQYSPPTKSIYSLKIRYTRVKSEKRNVKHEVSIGKEGKKGELKITHRKGKNNISIQLSTHECYFRYWNGRVTGEGLRMERSPGGGGCDVTVMLVL
jgi:hypothetical protein